MSVLILPNLPVAVVFAVLMLSVLAVASWIDLKTLLIPKRLTIILLIVGVVVSITRGLWAGVEEKPVWVLNGSSAIVGALDGFLFSLSGAVVGFAVFFPLWMTRIFVGGGDVKLVTAAGAWLGPNGVLLAALLSLFVFAILAVGRIAVEISQGVMPSLAPRSRDTKERKARRRISYSLSFTVGTALVLLMTLTDAYRAQLGLPVRPLG